MTAWEIEGSELVNCNCSYGCPCQFNALPTHGFCEAMGAIAIEKGHYGATHLDGLRIGFVFHWPGPIHEGKGQCQAAVDERATPEQREALLKIMSGQDTEPFATMFAVFASTVETMYPPMFIPINFEVDVDARRGRITAGKLFEVAGEPIRNPVTGAEHRVRIDLPNGFEYELAEIGSGTSRSSGNVALNLDKTYAQFARLHLNNKGPVRHRHAA
ncbi:MAG: DUF1326 domain-containing protein [Burkholderiaceae bacterium]|nr:DUF1326 domain-containing protein [Burkholderiaceae bacterium]